MSTRSTIQRTKRSTERINDYLLFARGIAKPNLELRKARRELSKPWVIEGSSRRPNSSKP